MSRQFAMTEEQQKVVEHVIRPLVYCSITPKWYTDVKQKEIQYNAWVDAFGDYDEKVLQTAYNKFCIDRKTKFFPEIKDFRPYVLGACRMSAEKVKVNSHLDHYKKAFLKWYRDYDRFQHTKETFYQRINRKHTFYEMMQHYEFEKKTNINVKQFDFSFEEVGALMWRDGLIQEQLEPALFKKQDELKELVGDDVANTRYGMDMSFLLKECLSVN
jgi:hypothetical protein